MERGKQGFFHHVIPPNARICQGYLGIGQPPTSLTLAGRLRGDYAWEMLATCYYKCFEDTWDSLLRSKVVKNEVKTFELALVSKCWSGRMTFE